MDLLFRSIVVSFGASTIAVIMASMLALATFGRCHFVSRFQSALISSILLLPSYLVAGAWSAGFGSLGWWTLSQVTAAKAPLVGIASVIWIHAMAATPVAYWVLIIGLRRCPSTSVELGLVEGGPMRQFFRGILPSWSVWMAGAFFSIAAWVSGDMVVTNLFQVTTLAERCYMDMMADQATWKNMIAACSLSILSGVAGFAVVQRAWNRGQRMRQASSWNTIPLGSDRLGFMVGWFVLFFVVGIPLANLIIKLGWVSKYVDVGSIERTWRIPLVFESMIRVPFEYSEDFQWSLSLASWSATLALAAAASSVLLVRPNMGRRKAATSSQADARNRIAVGCLFAMAIVSFSLPGPIVSALMIHLFQLPISGLAWLNDHTLLAPILCLQFRLVPLAVFAFAIFEQQWQNRVGDVWRIDAAKPLYARMRVYLLAISKFAFTLWGLLFAVGFGDLSSYLQCLPPGVTPVSMRIFDLLHYGVRSSEAGLLLFLAFLGTLIGWWILRNRSFGE